MPTSPKFNYLFDFSVSASGGGRKNCLEVAKWFRNNGGAYFIVNEKMRGELRGDSVNEYFYVSPSNLKRFFSEGYWLKKIQEQIGVVDFFFSYGIPVQKQVGKINWFHLSNIIPLDNRPEYSSTKKRYYEYELIKKRIEKMSDFVQCISAESKFALEALRGTMQHKGNTFCFRNGVEFEIINSKNQQNTAISVGTEKYKDLQNCLKVFDELKKSEKVVKLLIVGDESKIPQEILCREDIEATGVLHQEKVYELLRISQYYIHTTMIENSSNASIEGILLSENAILSDIEPHRELVEDPAKYLKKIGASEELYLQFNSADRDQLLIGSWPDAVNDLFREIQKVSS